MKKTSFIAISAIVFLVACSKERKNEKPENLCPIVAASTVPQIVKDSFAVRYPGATVSTWFNKDGIAYCAYYVVSGVDNITELANNGSFIKEEVVIHQEGQYEDSTMVSGVKGAVQGCECEIDKEHE